MLSQEVTAYNKKCITYVELIERGQIIGVNALGDDSANFNFAVAINHVNELLNKVPESTEVEFSPKL